MADIEVTSSCAEGYAVDSDIDGDWDLVVDAANDEGPTAQQVLAANYASCYVPALRVAGQQRGYDDLGAIEVAVDAALDEDDDLAGVAFDVSVEADVSGDEAELVERGKDICHVESALQDDLSADVTLNGTDA